MKEVFLNNLLTNIKKTNNYSETKLLEIRYGLETIYLTITKTLVYYLVAFLIGIQKELTMLIVFYSILRLTGFGLHAKKSYQCWITSSIIFIGVPILIKYLVVPDIVKAFLLPILSVSILKYAPADTEKRPLVNAKKRHIYKTITFIESILYSVTIIISTDRMLTNTLFFSMILQVIVILPLVYKLFNLPYNNYIRYKKKGG